MNIELTAIEAALQHPFPCDMVRFKPTDAGPNPTTKRWECRALPYADIHTYEDRLNDLAFGHWSTPYTSVAVYGNKLVTAVTIMIYGVAHTNVGEAFLSTTSSDGQQHDEKNAATEAYSQAFRRACAQFGLGRYLYQLPPLWLPYNPTQHSISLAQGERIAWVEKLYMEAGLSPRPKRVDPVSHQGSSPEVQKTTSAPPPQPQSIVSRSHAPKAPTTDLVDATLLASIQREITEKQKREALRYYNVADLAHLTATQATELSQFIEERKHQKVAPVGVSR